jgi:hypothetical protein
MCRSGWKSSRSPRHQPMDSLSNRGEELHTYIVILTHWNILAYDPNWRTNKLCMSISGDMRGDVYLNATLTKDGHILHKDTKKHAYPSTGKVRFLRLRRQSAPYTDQTVLKFLQKTVQELSYTCRIQRSSTTYYHCSLTCTLLCAIRAHRTIRSHANLQSHRKKCHRTSSAPRPLSSLPPRRGDVSAACCLSCPDLTCLSLLSTNQHTCLL